MKHTVFTGAGTAIITPMNEKGVDWDAFGKIIDFQINDGIDALIVCGTTGEAATLNDSDHLSVIEYAASRANKKVPIVAGAGSNDTAHGINLSREAVKRGADALLWVTPYYNKTTQRGLIKHYEAMAAAVDVPAILYNVPSRTGLDIKPETVAELSKIDNIVGIKEATGKISTAIDIIRRCGDRIDVYSGDDDITVPLMSIGAKGVISVLSNIMPKQVHEMCDLCLKNDFEKAGKMQNEYYSLIKALFIETNPIPVKTAMNLMGFNAGLLRLPLYEMAEENVEILKEEMKKFNLI